MAVVIPAPNRNTQASRTAAPQINIDTNVGFRDIGLGDAAKSLQPLAAAKAKAVDAKSTGMMNATYNEGVRIIQETYTNFKQNVSNKGYGSANSVKRVREQVAEKFAKLKSEGFTLEDGSSVPALSDKEWQSVLTRLDARLIDADGDMVAWEGNEFAQRATNDFQSSVSIAGNTIVKSGSEEIQNNAINEIAGLARAYHQGRLSEEGVTLYARETGAKSLDTRAKNLTSTNPRLFLEEASSNKNYERYGVDISGYRKTAISNMAKVAGMNSALIANGQRPVAQDWTDEEARSLMSEMEYALYSVEKAEVGQTKSAAISKDVRKMNNSVNLQLMQDANKVETQQEWNDLVNKTLLSGDSYGAGQTLQMITTIKDDAQLYQDDSSFVRAYSDIDGNFNEDAVMVEAAARAEAMGIGNNMHPIAKSATRDKYIKEYTAIARGNFAIKKQKLQEIDDNAINSAVQVQKFYESITAPDAPITPQEVEGIAVMTPTDKAVVTETLLKRAQLRKTIDDIQRAEGDTFDMSKLALSAWNAAGNPYKITKNLDIEQSVKEGDAEKFAKFYDRFATLYVKAYGSINAKPDSATVAEIARNALNTYETNVSSSNFSKDMNNLRLLARRSYDKVEVSQPEMRKAIKEYLEAGWWERTFSLDTEGVTSETYQALQDLYQSLPLIEQQLLIQQIATGGDSLIYRILEQKGFK